MKPIKLIMKGFMTFKNETVIDFSHFGSKGLFLVTGDTGAGKSTIFDAMSYALFDELSGNLRSKKNVVSDFLEEGEECFVEFEFYHKGEIYKIKRCPKQKRKKLRGGGTTESSDSISLKSESLGDLSGLSKKEINEKIIEIIGMTRTQFKQIAMLAQGEFMNLLNADSKNREAILRKIFNTEIFDNFKNRLEIMKKNLESACKSGDLALIQELKNIKVEISDENYGEIFMWLEEGCNINKAEKIIEQLEALNIDDEKRLAIFKEEKENSDLNYNKASLELEVAKNDNKLFERKNYFEEVAKEIEKERLSFKEREKTFSLILKAEEVESFFKEYKKEQDKLKNLKAKESINREKLEGLKRESSEAESQLKNALDSQKEIDYLLGEITKLGEEIKEYDGLEALKAERDKRNKEKAENEKLYNIVENGLEKLTNEKEEYKKQIEKLKNAEIDCLKCQNEKNENEKFAEELDKLKNSLEDIFQLENQSLKLELEFKKSEEEYYNLSEKYENARKAFLLGQAGIMAQRLEEGEECPVCGSKHHPKKADFKEIIFDEKEIKKIEEEKNEKNKDSSNKAKLLSENKGKLEGKVKDFLESFKALTKLELEKKKLFEEGKTILVELREKTEKKMNELTARLLELERACQEKASFEKKVEKLEERLVNGNKKFEEVKLEKTELEKAIIEVESRIKTKARALSFESKNLAEKELENKRNKKEILQKNINEKQETLDNALKSLEATKAVLKEIEENIKETDKNCQLNKKAYNERLSENAFSEEDFFMLLEKKAEKEKIKAFIDSFKEKELQNKISLEELNKSLKNKKIKNIEALEENCNALFEAREISSDKFIKLFNKLENNKRILENAQEFWKKQEIERKKFLSVDELYKTASGNLTGKNRISIENYVQGFYFKRMVNAANQRLNDMTDGQFELLQKENATKRVDEAFALDLVVFDYYTGKTREISSLSGGESFKAALSLALGVSEVIQQEAGGIEIDALFIDEGFGSLDEYSLEQAIAVLNALSDGNRLIGIISHVNELKERITKKIIVEKSIEGSRATISY